MTVAPALRPPIEPMLAAPAGSGLPLPDVADGTVAYEPKWDGFRCLLFRDDNAIVVQGRGGDDLAYCFPELVDEALRQLPDGIVLDGELVAIRDSRLRFDLLTSRLRPRKEAGGASIAALASECPTTFVAFDLLGLDGRSLMGEGFGARRAALESVMSHLGDPFRLTPLTLDIDVAARWFAEFEGAGLDGLIAKPLDAAYAPGKRTLLKIKHSRTADVVVAGWRAHSTPGPDGTPVVGSLLVGLFDGRGRLHHVGAASGFTAKRRAELVTELAHLAVADGETHPWTDVRDDSVRVPGAQSRWSSGRDTSFVPLRPELVAEVSYDQMEGDRFRHVAKLVRWRPDRDPASCGFAQLARAPEFDVTRILG